MKIVVLTGSFNPVTKAHFSILSNAVTFLHADKGYFVATNGAYLLGKTRVKAKSRTSFLLSEETRREMLSALSQEDPRLSFWGFELGGASPSTEKTLQRIAKGHKGDDIYYLCGADKLHAIPHWSNADSMLELVHLAVFPRADIDFDVQLSAPFYQRHRDHVVILPAEEENLEVSSTEVRRRFFAGKDYQDLLMGSTYEILKKFQPSDFPPLTPEQIIEATIRYGGQFGKNSARTTVFKENTKLFREFDEARFGSKEELIEGTQVYKEEFHVPGKGIYETIFDCLNIDASDAAYSLIEEGYVPAILNLASSIVPCGGYDKGYGAQEESLCQCSTLSVSLYQFGNPNKKHIKSLGYKRMYPDVYPLDINYGGIYSPNVTFFRYPFERYFTLREQPFVCSVISVPSLSFQSLAEFSADDSVYFDEAGHLNEAGLAVERNKIRTILRIALDHHHDALVLGAFGCGAYHLDPTEVATLFYDVFHEEEFQGRFKKVVFAIKERSSRRKPTGKEGMFKPFYNLFGRSN